MLMMKAPRSIITIASYVDVLCLIEYRSHGHLFNSVSSKITALQFYSNKMCANYHFPGIGVFEVQ